MLTIPFDIGSILWDAFIVLVLFFLASQIAKISVVKNLLLPTCLIAGVLGLLVSIAPGLPKVIVHSRFEFYVYHSLALLFVVMGLKKPAKKSRGAINIGAIMVMTYLLQALVGLAVLFVFISWIDPDAIPAIGLLLPLSFGMGPGTAFTIGQSWSSYGIENGGQIGLALASMGFVIAYLVGVGILNFQKPEKMSGVSTDVHRSAEGPVVDAFSKWMLLLLLAMTLAIYGVALVLISLASSGLEMIGLASQTPVLWSFHFLFAFFLTVLIRPFFYKMINRNDLSSVLDIFVGFWAGLMIASSIIAINVLLIAPHLFLITCLVVPGGFATWWIVRKAIRKSFQDHVFKRYLGLFGEMTGTLSSGLALVMATDPAFETPVARDMALGSAYALAFGFPLLALINAPLSVFQGSLTGYFFTFGVCLAYFGLVFLLWSKFNTVESRIN